MFEQVAGKSEGAAVAVHFRLVTLSTSSLGPVFLVTIQYTMSDYSSSSSCSSSESDDEEG